MDETLIIKVAANSSTTGVGGAIAHSWRDGKRRIALRAIGAGAVNQAVKAVAIASQYLGITLACIPEFKVAQIDGQSKTAIALFIVEINDQQG